MNMYEIYIYVHDFVHDCCLDQISYEVKAQADVQVL